MKNKIKITKEIIIQLSPATNYDYSDEKITVKLIRDCKDLKDNDIIIDFGFEKTNGINWGGDEDSRLICYPYVKILRTAEETNEEYSARIKMEEERKKRIEEEEKKTLLYLKAKYE